MSMPNVTAVREQARQAYRDSVAAGAVLSGRALGERYGRSARWGRDRIAESRTSVPIGGSSGSEAEEPAAAAVAWQPHGADPAAASAASAASASAPAAAPAAGARFVAWVGFLFGAVMSVAANVLHTWLPAVQQAPGWAPGIAPQVGSAVWPIGLLLSVEVLSRVRWAPGWWWAVARYGGAGMVAVGSAVISYSHLHGVLIAWQYGPLGAAVGPLVLDGLMVVSGFALLAMSGREHNVHGETAASTDFVTETVTGRGRR